MRFFERHDARPGTLAVDEWTAADCASSLQVVPEETRSRHHDHLARCPTCDTLCWAVNEEETLAELRDAKEDARRQFERAGERLELFRARLAQLR